MQQLIYCGLVGIGIFIGIGLTMLAQSIYFADEEKPYDWEDEEW